MDERNRATPVTPTINLEVTMEDMELNPIDKIYTGLSPDEQQYFKKYPDLLPTRIISARMQEKAKANPQLAEMPEELYRQSKEEFDSYVNPKSILDMPEEDIVIPQVPQPKQGWFRRLINVAGRSIAGVGTGFVDFGLEATSAAGRAADTIAEAVNLDLFDDDDSWFYQIKEGLSEETKEQWKSFGGLFPKGSHWSENLGESLGSLALGTWVLSGVLAGVGAMKWGTETVGIALKGTRPAQAVSQFLSNHQKIATIARLSADGAKVDLAAAMTADPTVMLGILSPKFVEYFDKLDPMERRGWNLAEGLFVNLMIGTAGKLYNGLQAPKLSDEVIGSIKKDIGNIPQFDEVTVEGLREAFRKIEPEILKQADEMATKMVSVDDAVETMVRPQKVVETIDEVLEKVKPTEVPVEVPVQVVDPAVAKQLAKEESERIEAEFLKKALLGGNIDTPAKIKKAKKLKEAKDIAKANPEVTPGDVLKIDEAVGKVIKSEADSGSKVIVLNDTTVKTYGAIGAGNKSSGFQFGNDQDSVVFTHIKDYLSPKSSATISKETVDSISSALKITKPEAKKIAQETLKQLRSAIKGEAKSYAEGWKALKYKIFVRTENGIEATTGALVSGKMIDNMATKRELKPETILKVIGDELKALGRRGSITIPTEAIERVAKEYPKKLLNGALKAGYAALEHGGLAGGAAAGFITNYLGIDVNLDGEVNLYDMAYMMTAFGVSRAIIKHNQSKELTQRTMERVALANEIKAAQRDVIKVYIGAKKVLEKAVDNTVDPEVIKSAKKVIKELDGYLFGTKEGLEDLAKHPVIAKGIKDTTRTLDDEALQTLRLSLQSDDVSILSVGNHLSLSPFDLATPEGVRDTFDYVRRRFANVFSEPGVASGMRAKQHHLLKLSDDIFAEFKVPQTVRDAIWNNLSPEGRATIIHTTRTILSSIDSKIKSFVTKEGSLSVEELYQFQSAIAQRKAVGEYLRSGGALTSQNLGKITQQVSKASMMSLFPEAMVKNIPDHMKTVETLEAIRLYLGDGVLTGASLSKFIDQIGADMTIGKMGVQVLYNFMFSNPLTAAKPFIENTVGLAVGMTKEMLDAASRGQFYQEILSSNGLFAGLVGNLGKAIEGYKNKLLGKNLGFDDLVQKEFMDYRFTEQLSQFMKVEEPGFLNRTFHKFMDAMSIRPIDAASAPDTFFKILSNGAFQNQKVVQKALDTIASDPRITLGEAIANIRNDPATMFQINKEALDAARFLTYTATLDKDSLAGRAVSFLSHPVLKLIIPIIKTPVNQARHAIANSPLNFLLVSKDRTAMWNAGKAWAAGDTLTPVMRREVADVMSRAVTGSLISYGIYQMIESSGWEIIGTGEFDPSFQAKAARGARQNGLWNSKSGEFISLERWGLFKMTLGTLADLGHWGKSDMAITSPEFAENAAASLGYMVYSLVTQAQPDQLEGIQQMLGGSTSFERAAALGERELGAFFSRLIPSVFRTAGRESDEYKRAYIGPWQSAVAAIYSGMSEGNAFRPATDIYGKPIPMTKGIMSSKGIPEGDELFSEAEAAGYDLKGMMGRRQRVGGIRLGSSQDEQDLAYLAEKFHGEHVEKNRKALLADLKRAPDSKSKHDVLTRFFRSTTATVKHRLTTDPRTSETVKRLLDNGGITR